MNLIHTPVSLGELIDKITILEIKSERIPDVAKLKNIKRELELLESTWQKSEFSATDIVSERTALKKVNEALWVIEDDIRLKEGRGEFDDKFIELARAVYVTNDKRMAIKRQINDKLGSEIVEEKSYADYTRK